MDWLIENKEWLFSGIGVFLLGLLLGGIHQLSKNGLTEFIDGYYVPNTLSYFRHSTLVGTYVALTARRIMSIHALRTKKLLIKYPIFSTGTLENAVSLSDPGCMKLIKPNEVEGYNSLEIVAKRKEQYLIASESKRIVYPDKMCNAPSEFNKVIHSLIKHRITSPKHEFNGTRVVAKTRSLRIIVEFDPTFKPDYVHPIQIKEDGNIMRDEKSSDFVMAVRKDGTLFILDLHRPDVNSGVYLWWKWPELSIIDEPVTPTDPEGPLDSEKQRA